ncbi:hypothetical protein J6590_018140 [Homalodisca vitripennis]|nr:hypothetical protein J6590_018140 [Homalodisca vitripennis]
MSSYNLALFATSGLHPLLLGSEFGMRTSCVVVSPRAGHYRVTGVSLHDCCGGCITPCRSLPCYRSLTTRLLWWLYHPVQVITVLQESHYTIAVVVVSPRAGHYRVTGVSLHDCCGGCITPCRSLPCYRSLTTRLLWWLYHPVQVITVLQETHYTIAVVVVSPRAGHYRVTGVSLHDCCGSTISHWWNISSVKVQRRACSPIRNRCGCGEAGSCDEYAVSTTPRARP